MIGSTEPDQPIFSAVLIGVPHYDSDDFPSIPTVPNDLHQLQRVLEESGYEGHVRVYPENTGGDGNSRPLVTGFQIAHQLREACANAPEGGVLFLYFSGHGVSHENHDFLVPGDAPSLADVLANPQFLVNVDLSRYLMDCKARAVVFAVDACRDNMGQGKGMRLQAASEFGYGAIDPEHKTRIATIYGCDRDQFCYFSTELKMSLFARALCVVMSPDHKAQKLGDVIDSVDKELISLVERYKQGRTQRVHVMGEGGAGSINDQVICQGSAESWRAAIRGSSLWQLASGASAGQVDTYRSLAESIASDVWKASQANAARLPDDPWRDPFYLQRCLSALELLIPAAAKLSIAEILVLVTAPFLAEARQAEAVRQLLDHHPLDLSAGLSTELRRQELEAVYSAYSRVWQKASTLAKSEPTDADALAAWLMYRCTLRQVGFWREEPVLGLSKQLAETLDQRAGFRGGDAAAFRGIASFLGTGAEELDAFLQGSAEGDRSRASEDVEIELPDGGRARVRGRLLAAWLAIAGMLAFDLRRFGEVVVDHVGIRDPLDPVDLRRAVREAQWVLSDGRTTLRLEARCVHPATHLALREVCEAAQQQLNVVHRWSNKAGDTAPLIAALPLSISTDDLGPELDTEGRQVYETPLLQFRLAHNEIRDLLMGARLYGDPALAVRELYQNALDACRYRSLRAMFRGQPYQGKIRITQGVEDGRSYIECVDNGVGMGRRELENTFSRAGRRFVTSTEFLWEQAEWLRMDDSLRLWPNSQFGIGVFSYFMLADEIFVETAQVDRVTNTPAELLHVQIASSGSLFRITTAERSFRHGNDVETGGGTRVRLYLRDQEAEKVSCVDTLAKLLWFSEFDVVATHGKAERRWAAGRLKAPNTYYFVDQAGPSIWWVNGEGMLLADGVATDTKPFGYVANLTGENRPVLSVDRNKLEGWNREWLRAQLHAAASRLPRLTGLSFTWLQQFVLGEPEIAQEIFSEIMERDTALPVGGDRHETAMIREVGLWPNDIKRLNPNRYFPNISENQFRWGVRDSYFDASRVKTWRQAGIALIRRDEGEPPRSRLTASRVWALPGDTRGHPLLEPADATAMLGRGYEYNAMGEVIKKSHATQTPVADLLRRVRRFVIHGATPPSVADAVLIAMADELDVRLADALGYPRSPLPAAAAISYQTARPFASVIVRAYRFVGLLGWDNERTATRHIADSDYVCRSGDSRLLSQVVSRSMDGSLENRNWLPVLLRPDIDVQDVENLMRMLHAPFELLRELAAAAFADDPLARLLSRDADSAQGWLKGEVSLLHLLIGSSAVGAPPGTVAEAMALYQEALGYRMPTGLPTLPADPVPAQTGILLRILNQDVLPSRRQLEQDGRDPDSYIVVTALSYQSGLPPRSVLQALAPYRAYLDATLPDDVSCLPDRTPTDAEADILDAITARDLRTSPTLLTAAADELNCGLNAVEEVARRWRVPVREDRELDAVKLGAMRHGKTNPSRGDFDALDERDRRLLEYPNTFVEGVLSPAYVIMVALANRETIDATLERVRRLADRFRVSPPDFAWGDMRHAELPTELDALLLEPFDAPTAVGVAHDLGITVATIFRRLMPFARALDLPCVTEQELSRLEVRPDDWDLVALAPIEDYSSELYRAERLLPRDALHVIRVAGRLGLSIGAVTKRIEVYMPILEESPPIVTAEAEEVVPDWRDLVILTPGLDGRRLLTDEDLTESHITRAAREVETTPEDVRRRLTRYASYCQFAVPDAMDPDESLPAQDDDL
jgi:hypothetical protein